MTYLLFGAVACILAVLTAVIVDWRWPAISSRRLVVISSLVCPILYLILIIAGSVYFLSEECPPEEVCDAGAMAFAGVVMIGSISICFALVFGFVAAHVTVRYLRRP